MSTGHWSKSIYLNGGKPGHQSCVPLLKVGESCQLPRGGDGTGNARPREQPGKNRKAAQWDQPTACRAWGLQKTLSKEKQNKDCSSCPMPVPCHPLSTLYSETLYNMGWLLLFPIYLCVKCIYLLIENCIAQWPIQSFHVSIKSHSCTKGVNQKHNLLAESPVQVAVGYDFCCLSCASPQFLYPECLEIFFYPQSWLITWLQIQLQAENHFWRLCSVSCFWEAS